MRLSLDLPSTPVTAAEFDALPPVEGFRLELWEGPRIPEYWLVEKHPGRTADAEISVFRLTPAGSYEMSARLILSELRPLQL